MSQSRFRPAVRALVLLLLGCTEPRDTLGESPIPDARSAADTAADTAVRPPSPSPEAGAPPSAEAGAPPSADAGPEGGSPPPTDAGASNPPPVKDTGDLDRPIPSTVSCGGTLCPAGQRAQAVCVDTAGTPTCSSICEAQASRCYGSADCEALSWGFESSVDGWKTSLMEGDPVRGNLHLSSAQVHGGAAALEAVLDIDATLVPARDRSWISYNLCGSLVTWRKEQSIDFTGKTLSAWVFVAPAAGAPPAEVTCRFFANAGNGMDTIYLMPTQTPAPVPANQWTEVRAQLGEPAAVNTKFLALQCSWKGPPRWNGSLFLDDITVR